MPLKEELIKMINSKSEEEIMVFIEITFDCPSELGLTDSHINDGKICVEDCKQCWKDAKYMREE